MRKQIYRQISNFLADRKLVRGFTITELLVAIGLLAAVLAVSSVIFNYSIDAQRTASATAEIMRTLRAVTDQLNINLGFQGLQKDGYLVLWSSSDVNDAIYFFSAGDFKSWCDPDGKVNSNIARVYFGPSGSCPNDLALDFVLLTPGESIIYSDCNDVNFAACQADITNFEDPCNVLTIGRPSTDIDIVTGGNPNNARSLLAQNVGSMKIEWTSDSSFWTAPAGQIEWFGENNHSNRSFEDTTNPSYYIAVWTPFNQADWPQALKFTFTLYDSKRILKTGRRFEHIVYIGD
ncbi:MAG: hypothetical protein A2173_10240 [Planctomycetes bacterium RBG_13_44_8b]|nr:MAG: hypothetical protein A2173_10240 [Planctomycetes bacterium RBG_13_44_8b]